MNGPCFCSDDFDTNAQCFFMCPSREWHRLHAFVVFWVGFFSRCCCGICIRMRYRRHAHFIFCHCTSTTQTTNELYTMQAIIDSHSNGSGAKVGEMHKMPNANDDIRINENGLVVQHYIRWPYRIAFSANISVVWLVVCFFAHFQITHLGRFVHWPSLMIAGNDNDQ